MTDLPPPAALSQDEIDHNFPLERPPLAAPDGAPVFEIGLALGGTVSAGAYTAGVLDMLVEALDAWTAAKERGEDVPRHAAVISVIGGASGGAINGALLLRAANFARPPLDAVRNGQPFNPFARAWTTGPTLAQLLAAPRTKPVGLRSLLDTGAIEETARTILAWQGDALGTGGGPRQRSYLATPLRLIMTLANVTGVPYRIAYQTPTGLGHWLRAHDDVARFALDVPGGIADAFLPARFDEIALATGAQAAWDDYVGRAVLATSAFPGAFPGRPFQRSWNALRSRAIAIPAANQAGQPHQPPEVVPLVPEWDKLREALLDGTDEYRSLNVDGGTFNNEPIEHVRRALAGWASRNPRGANATRAVVLIDPFSDDLTIGPHDELGTLKLAFPLIGALIQQARYKPEDIALAVKDDVNSRFLVAPWSTTPLAGITAGATAIASGGLGGFIGFIDPRFLRHDFELGRWNAWHFLRSEFVLPAKLASGANTPLFDDPFWTAAQRRRYASADDHLPIVPLVGALADGAPPAPDYAALKLAALPAGLDRAIKNRLDYVYEAVKAELGATHGVAGTFVDLLVDPVWSLGIRGKLRDAIIAALETALRKAHLL